MRYTFGLTDVAVKLLLGTKYQPVLFCSVDFKINSILNKCLFVIPLHSPSIEDLKIIFFFCCGTLFLFHKHSFPVIPQVRDCHFFISAKKYRLHDVLSIISFLPRIKYFHQYQCFVFATRAFAHVNAKALQHANLQRDLTLRKVSEKPP